jgi:hypothetical protein
MPYRLSRRELQFLGAGVNPVPPPQVQVEQVSGQARIKKDAQSGDPEP